MRSFVAWVLLSLLATQSAGANTGNYIFDGVGDGPPNWSGDTVVGTDSAGGYDHSAPMVPFTVSSPTTIGGVIMPFKGQDLMIELGTTPERFVDTGQGANVSSPTILESVDLPGTTAFGIHDIAMPPYQLLPGHQYYLILSAKNLGVVAGTWTGDYRDQYPEGSCGNRLGCFISPGNHPGAVYLRIYAAP